MISSFFKNIKIKFRYTEDIERLNIEKRIALLRITQEQLKNIVKYSEASLVTIELRTHLNNVHLAITDNGIGFDPDQSSNGIGLINIYNRVQLLKGVVNLQTAVGDGCVLSVIIPAN